MTEDEARRVLGLNATASSDEVAEAFRRLVRQSHPDSGGDGDAFRLICEARDVLIAPAGGGGLVPFRDVRDLVTMLTGPVAERERRLDLAEQTQKIVQGMVRIRSTRFRRLRRRLSLFAFVAAIAAAGTQSVRLVPSPSKAAIYVTTSISVGFAGIAILAAIGIAIATQQVSSVESDIEDINQTLNDKALVARLIRQIFRTTETNPPWTFDGWIVAVEEWSGGSSSRYSPTIILRSGYDSNPLFYCRRVGPVEFARLVYAKAKEQGVIGERESWENEQLIVTFEFNRTAGP